MNLAHFVSFPDVVGNISSYPDRSGLHAWV